MGLNKLDNFIKNIEGRILYVNPKDLDATDAITNSGNSLARPFKTIQRALIEAARFSYVGGDNNDIVEKTTILLFPGEHVIDNRPGWAIYDNGGAKVVNRLGVESNAVGTLGLDLNSVFDLEQEDNILYKFNSYYGGVVVPRGTSIVGLDLRKTKIRPKYVPNPTDASVKNSAIFKITGACYFWQFSFFDGNPIDVVYTNPDDSSSTYRSTPTFSHHKLTCFEYCDGVNNIGTYGLTDLDMYYAKLSNAFTAYRNIEEKFPSDPEGFAKSRPEWEIVGAFQPDPIEIESLVRTLGTNVITVTTKTPHDLSTGTPIKVRGVAETTGVSFPYNVSTTVQDVISETQFIYSIPVVPPNLNPNPDVSNATVTIETDTVSGASPYIFNCSLRSVWGMNGLHADGSKASGFRSIVVAQFTGISLQKDDRAFVKYDKESRAYNGVVYTTVNGAELPRGASQTDPEKVYHLDPDAVYRNGWETSHIKISNDAFIQVVSVFAIGYTKHFDAESGGDASITNSNSNFGQISLNSSGFKKEAFEKDNKAFITSIVTPRAIVSEEENIEWLSLDVGVTTTVGVSSHLYLYGFTSPDAPPSAITQGYRIGARLNDELYFTNSGTTYSASIYMCDNEISEETFTAATGTTSSVKSYDVTSGPTSNSFTIGTNNLITGEKVKIISDDGNLPENIIPHQTYYVIRDGANNIKLATSYTNAVQEQAIAVYGGTNLHILSRVSDKDAGELGSPIQYDAGNGNWFIHVNENNEIYNALVSGGTAVYGETTDLVYLKRIADERSLDEKLYKFRVVIPKEQENGKDPEAGFVIQESSTTGVGNSGDFTTSVIQRGEFDFKKNLRFISTCSVDSSTVTVISELPHNLQVGEIVIIRNVKCTENSTGEYNKGYNGRFEVTGITNALTFQYSTTDVDGNLHTSGDFTNDTTVRDEFLPRFERNDSKSNLYIYRNEVISPYIYNQQDGIYHLYVLNANNRIDNEFTNLEFGQLPKDLYPQLDRDNIDANPPAAKTYAKRYPIGAVVTNDLKKSITRESADLALNTLGIGLTISSFAGSTITFSRFHGLAGIVTGDITAGSGYNNGTYANVKLLNTSQTGSWRGATANVVVSGAGNSITSVEIVSPGSGYSVGTVLYFDQTRLGAGSNDARYTVTGISTGVGSVLQVTGIGTISDQYYRITSVPSATTVGIARTTGDPTITGGQYGFVVGPVVNINGTPSYDSATGITTFVTTAAHGLLSGNRFTVRASNNNSRGSFLVERKLSETSFTAVTNASVNAANGFILKHGLSSNEASSDARGENFGTTNITFYDNDTFTLSAQLLPGTTGESTITISSGIGTAQRLPVGSYVQVNNEIMRVKSRNNTTVTVIRGVFGTTQETHNAGSLVRKIKPIAVEFRRPSIIRASGHTFEYLGYGPGNYSTALPQVQVRTLSEEENFLSQSQERSCGTVVYTGMNNNGDFFSGNTKTSSVSGETVSFDIPNPTVTGEDASKLSVVFDEVTIKERLLVEGGKSKTVLSQFNGPVNFNGELRIKAKSSFNQQLKVISGTQSTSTTTGDVVVSGGVGIGGNLNVGGSLDASSINATTFSGKGTIPVGGIIMWSGTQAQLDEIPEWKLCDGNNGTPDLRNKFIVAANDISKTGITTQIGVAPYEPGDVGGSADAVVVSHSHTLNGGGLGGTTSFLTGASLSTTNEGVQSGGATVLDGVSLSTSSGTVTYTNPIVNPEGVSGTDKNLPPYYALAFIMRIA